jgi:nitroreductase
MYFYKVIEERHSVRSYLDKPVEEEKLERILRAAQAAPTAVNFQAFKIFVIPTEGRKELLKKVYHRDWFSQPPYVLLVCADIDKCWSRRDGKSYGDVDSAIVMDHIILAATAEGLGTCWIGAFDPAAAREAFDLPDNLEPVAFTPLGYERKTEFSKKRKDLKELVVRL